MIPEELRTLYTTLSDTELVAAKDNLNRYLLIAWEIAVESQQDML
jgi:hypothetical protein